MVYSQTTVVFNPDVHSVSFSLLFVLFTWKMEGTTTLLNTIVAVPVDVSSSIYIIYI